MAADEWGPTRWGGACAVQAVWALDGLPRQFTNWLAMTENLPKPLMPGGFTPSEQIKETGLPHGLARVGMAAKARYEHLVKLVELYK